MHTLCHSCISTVHHYLTALETLDARGKAGHPCQTLDTSGGSPADAQPTATHVVTMDSAVSVRASAMRGSWCSVNVNKPSQ
jgi:hypothetical protein